MILDGKFFFPVYVLGSFWRLGKDIRVQFQDGSTGPRP